MDGLQRITFRFGRDLEVRYLPKAPDAGDRVTHGRELWVVAVVSMDAVGVTIVCELPRRDGPELELVA